MAFKLEKFFKFKIVRKIAKGHGRGCEVGIKRAALFVQRESQKIVPIDTGHLRGSAGTRSEGSGWDTKAWVFYTANYAIYVHENLTAAHAPGKQAKYLTSILDSKKVEIMTIIRDGIKGKGR